MTKIQPTCVLKQLMFKIIVLTILIITIGLSNSIEVKAAGTIKVTLRAYDTSTKRLYELGTTSVSKGNTGDNITSPFTIPTLSDKFDVSTYSKITSISGNYVQPLDTVSEGDEVYFSNDNTSATITYTVKQWVKPSTNYDKINSTEIEVDISKETFRVKKKEHYIRFYENLPGAEVNNYIDFTIKEYYLLNATSVFILPNPLNSNYTVSKKYNTTYNKDNWYYYYHIYYDFDAFDYCELKTSIYIETKSDSYKETGQVGYFNNKIYGYIPDSWNTEPDGTGKTYRLGQEIDLAEYGSLYEREPLKLYLQYKSVLSYDTNVSSQTITYNTSIVPEEDNLEDTGVNEDIGSNMTNSESSDTEDNGVSTNSVNNGNTADNGTVTNSVENISTGDNEDNLEDNGTVSTGGNNVNVDTGANDNNSEDTEKVYSLLSHQVIFSTDTNRFLDYPYPLEEGKYEFLGWSPDKNYSISSESTTSSYTLYKPGEIITLTSDTDLYAVILENKPIEVVYELPLQNQSSYDKMYANTSTEVKTLSSANLFLDEYDYIFINWLDKQSGLTYNPGDIITPTDSMVLTAQYIPAPSYQTQEINSEDETTSPDVNNLTKVKANIPSYFSITIPKVIWLDTVTKQSVYEVEIEADISSTEQISVIPDETVVLTQSNKSDYTATISQDKYTWDYSETAIKANGLISALDAEAGSWSGTFNFLVTLEDKVN